MHRLLSGVLFFCLVFCFSSTSFSKPGFPIYGKWCGWGYGFNGPPVDEVDRLCMLHDICVQKTLKTKKIKKVVHGLQYCFCDALILKGMNKALRAVKKKKRMKAYRAGLLMKAYFSQTACFCDKRVCVPKPKCKKKRVCTKKLSTICAYKPVCEKVRKCKTVLGKKRCVTVPSCKKKRVCKKIYKGRICVWKPVCKTVRVCGKVTVTGRGGRCN